MFHTGLFTEEVRRCCPEIAAAFRAEDLSEIFEKVPAVSIDYGVMEKSGRVAVLPLSVKWSDLGSFDAFFEEFPRNEKGNVVFNGGILCDAADNLLYTDKGKLAALVGVRDLIVVEERDALLICPKDQAQRVKEVVARLKAAGDPRTDFHLTTYRPWGSYTILEEISTRSSGSPCCRGKSSATSFTTTASRTPGGSAGRVCSLFLDKLDDFAVLPSFCPNLKRDCQLCSSCIN